MYGGVHLMTVEGVENFQQDYEAARAFFAKKVFG